MATNLLRFPSSTSNQLKMKKYWGSSFLKKMDQSQKLILLVIPQWLSRRYLSSRRVINRMLRSGYRSCQELKIALSAQTSSFQFRIKNIHLRTLCNAIVRYCFNAFVMPSKHLQAQLEKIAPTWMNISLKMKEDVETDKAFGWVLEMSVLLCVQYFFLT